VCACVCVCVCVCDKEVCNLFVEAKKEIETKKGAERCVYAYVLVGLEEHRCACVCARAYIVDI